ncbi:MAG TPA: DUF4126 domain-containing protein [Candidatus Dormibacteraeota bacterium]|nr:DUF4126 domain-containing protein [Candidatus Dormibacteraeota bacterium]
MDPRLLTMPAAFGLAGASGLNASLPLLIISALARAGLVHLSPPFDALQSDAAFYGILCVAVIEFAMDKVPVLDSAGHFIMTPLAATSGAIIFASQTGTIRQVDPGLTVAMSLLIGAGTATAVHLTRATARPVANVALMGPVLSAFEDATAAVVALAVLLAPVLLPLAAGGIALAVWAIWRQRSRRRATALAQQRWGAYAAGYGQQPYGQPPYGYPPYGYPPYGYPPQTTQPYGGAGPPYRTG